MALRRTGVLLLTALALAGSSCGGGGDETAAAPDELVVDAGDVRLQARVVGDTDAPVVVLVHGGPGLSLEAMAPYEALADEGLRVVSYDQRGAGRSSEPPGGRYDLAAHVADLEAVRAALGVDAVSLLGQSWGGAVVSAYTAAHPARVDDVVLVGAVPLDLEAFLEGQQRFRTRVEELQRDGTVVDPLPEVVDGSCLPAFEAALPAYVAEPDDVPRLDDLSCDAAASRATYEAFVDDDLADRAARLRAFDGRVSVIAGEHDVFGPAWVRRNLELFAGADAEEHLVDGAGHLVAAERPEELLELVGSFLDG